MFTGNQIREKRKREGLTVRQLADILNVSEGSLYKWEKGVRPNNLEDYSKVENWLAKENVTGGEKPYIKMRLEAKNFLHEKRVPYYDAKVSASNITLGENDPITSPSGSIDVGDLLRDSQAAIRIYGNSMLPNYPPGCVVGLVPVTSSYIEPGEVYVVETVDRRMLKRLFYKDDAPAGDVFTCVSDNTMKFENGGRHGKLAYPSFDIQKSEIIKLFSVTGVIKRNTNSVIINR